MRVKAKFPKYFFWDGHDPKEISGCGFRREPVGCEMGPEGPHLASSRILSVACRRREFAKRAYTST